MSKLIFKYKDNGMEGDLSRIQNILKDQIEQGVVVVDNSVKVIVITDNGEVEVIE